MPGGGEAQGDDDDILGPLSDHFDAGTRCGYETSLGNSVMRVVGPSLDVAVPRPHVDSPPRHVTRRLRPFWPGRATMKLPRTFL